LGTGYISPPWRSYFFLRRACCGFSFPADLDWWNRGLALPVFNLGVLCIGTAWIKSPLLVGLTVATRLLVMASLAILVALRVVPPITLGIGVIDLISATLTIWALAAEARRRPD
jgi:hypothetical protein